MQNNFCLNHEIRRVDQICQDFKKIKMNNFSIVQMHKSNDQIKKK